jgi:hypothetical protein
MRKRAHLEDQGVEGSSMLKWIFKMLDGDMDWIDHAQDAKRWRVLVNAVMDFGTP